MNKRIAVTVVMPVYNESGSIFATLLEWTDVLRTQLGHARFRFCVVDDGSTDHTRAELERARLQCSEIDLIFQPNSGHGSACRTGYLQALKLETEWILQIDSDGQCDPKDFARLWAKRTSGQATLGLRWVRQDGWLRWLLSKVVSGIAFFVTGSWLMDANVPYRLIPRELLRVSIADIPERCFFTNVLLSVCFQRYSTIAWSTISFRERTQGSSTVKLRSLQRYGHTLVRELRALHEQFGREGLASSWIRREHHRLLLSQLGGLQKVLEIGSGNSTFARMLRVSGHQVTTVDLKDPADYVGDIRNWERLGLKSGSFDLVVAREVIEHVDCLAAMQALCRQDGLIFMTSPHPSYDNVMKWLERIGINQKRTSPHDHLVDFATIPLPALVRRRPFWVQQVALFVNHEKAASQEIRHTA